MELTKIESDHRLLMRNIVQSLSGTPYVLKGGTALMFGYGLDRFSEDLDFDSVKKLNLETKIKENLPQNFNLLEITKPKDTNTVQRYKVTYKTPNGIRRLKIETSYRNQNINKDDYDLVDGMQIYNLDYLLDNKIQAAHDGDKPRTTARDLYDIHFIIDKYPNILTPRLITRLKEFTADENIIFNRYEDAYNEDLLVNERIELDTLILGLSEKIKTYTKIEEYLHFSIEGELERTGEISKATKERIIAYGSLMDDKALIEAVESEDKEDLAALGDYFQELSQNEYLDYESFDSNQLQEMR